MGFPTSMRFNRLPRLCFRRILPVYLVGILSINFGCSSTRKRPSAPLPPHYSATKVIDEAAPEGTYPAVERETADSLSTALAKQSAQNNQSAQLKQLVKSQPINVLILSGGGQYAAFAGGILVGWTAAGTRPDFDVVTGVSSGGLTAVFAFLGPKYDSIMERMTNIKNSDIYRIHPVINLIKQQSLASYKPFERLVDRKVNDECIADIRAAHQAGRRLFIGTQNLHTRRLVIWDVGAIAHAVAGPMPFNW